MNNDTKICCIVILAMLVVCAILVAPVRAYGDFWVERTPMPNSGVFLKAVTLNDRIHVIGSNYTAASNFHSLYDPVIDTWVSKESMTLYRANFAVATYQDKIYVIGGFTGVSQQFIPTATSSNEMYDPATDRWISKMALPVAEGFLQAVTINEKIYVLGGVAYNGERYDISGINYVYDPASDSWESLASIPLPVYNFAMAASGDKIYAIGGHLNSQEYSDQTQIYDTQTNTWSFGKPAPITTVSRAAVATTGISAPARIYYIGAEDDPAWASTKTGPCPTQIYDPQTDSWTTGTSMPTPRMSGFALAVVNDTVYAIGGHDGAIESRVNEQYFPPDYKDSTTSPSSQPQTPTPSPPASSPDDKATLELTLLLGIIIAIVVGAIIITIAVTHKKRR